MLKRRVVIYARLAGQSKVLWDAFFGWLSIVDKQQHRKQSVIEAKVPREYCLILYKDKPRLNTEY